VKKQIPEYLRFLISGGLAAGVNFGSRFVFSTFVSFQVAVPLAYVVGMVLAFSLFRTQVFLSRSTSLQKSILRFTVVNAFGLLQAWLVSVWLVTFINVGSQTMDEAVAHFAGMSLAVVTSYLGHRFYTFRV
jgi:putative flippase GtrA